MSDSAPPPPPPSDPYGSNPYGQTPGQAPYGQTPGQVPGQGPYGAPPGPQPGSLLDRFVARLIDFVLLFVVNFIVVGVIVTGIVLGAGGSNGLSENGVGYGVGLVSAVLSTVIYLGYFTLMESTQGRTVGKMAMKLRTVGPAGGKPTTVEALKRNIFTGFSIVGIIPVVGSFLGGLAALVAMILIAVQINGDPAKRQAWHDKFAGGTEVLKEG